LKYLFLFKFNWLRGISHKSNQEAIVMRRKKAQGLDF